MRSLEIGGAERQLTQLAKALHARGVRVAVGVFYRRGSLVAELEQASIPILDLAKRGRWDLISFTLRLRRALLRARPDVVYSFLGGANIVAAAVRLISPKFRLSWSVRASDMDLSQYDWTHTLGSIVERLLSRVPDVIIANSAAGRDFAIRAGFPSERLVVVPNGIDVDRFRPDAKLRKKQRESWGLSDQDIAVGVLARLDPMKDHATLFRAFSLIAEKHPMIRMYCIGDGPLRQRLQELAGGLGISQRVRFTGETDPVAALNALDCVCSSSITEGFPNALAEAMACGTPCVATDAGDTAIIIGDCGTVVPARDPAALACAITHAITTRSTNKSIASRQRIVGNFSISTMVEKTLHLLGSRTDD